MVSMKFANSTIRAEISQNIKPVTQDTRPLIPLKSSNSQRKTFNEAINEFYIQTIPYILLSILIISYNLISLVVNLRRFSHQTGFFGEDTMFWMVWMENLLFLSIVFNEIFFQKRSDFILYTFLSVLAFNGSVTLTTLHYIKLIHNITTITYANVSVFILFGASLTNLVIMLFSLCLQSIRKNNPLFPMISNKPRVRSHYNVSIVSNVI